MSKTIRKTLILILLACLGISQSFAQAVVFPQENQPGTAKLAKSGENYVLSNAVLSATYTMSNGDLTFAGSEQLCLGAATDLFKLTLGNGTVVKSSDMTLASVEMQTLTGTSSAVKGSHKFNGKQLVANYTYGNLQIVWRAVLRDGSHYLRTDMDIVATADQAMKNIIPMMYTLNNTTVQVVGNTRGAVLAGDKIFAGLETPMGQNTVSGSAIQGLWSRATTLKAGKTWNVGAVVGLVADGQARRSFLAYSERERAVPWRPFPLYNSWYELNINRKDNSSPSNNMKTSQATDVLAQWKSKLFDAQNVGIKSFVWDDGWDNYQTWECHSNFDFTTPSATAEAMGAGTGVWLSPVGGYGTSGDKRRSYWSSRGGMELSNDAYYEVFKAAASKFVTQYNGNFFKFDGISAQSVATGPDTDATGEEDAEGIISMERDIRTLKEDIFLNTTVGTWASPFWYQFTDATWRQENDYGEFGGNSIDRENWITYRDQLVYKHYVQNSPLCPINTLMTHGFILSQYGKNSGYSSSYDNGVSENISYDAVLREMRCAFACGSAMVELYCDHYLMSNIADGSGTKGVLWKDLAECINWQEKNKDVLPDIHWVGGTPATSETTGSWFWEKTTYTHYVYGWASWNGKKATLALRNGGNNALTYTSTLREVLDIPDYITGVSITLSKAFSHSQADLSGLPTGSAIDIDTQFTVSLPASSVYVFDGQQFPETTFEAVEEEPEPDPEPVVVATPVINPNGGEVEAGSTVTLTCATENATIHYTLDGTEPTAQSTKYEAPVAITKACTLKAVAVKEGNYTDSQVATAVFTIKAKEVVATPAFSISGGEVEEGTQVTISCATSGATVYYTTDGSAPSTSSAKYTGAITVSKAMTIKAIAVKDGYYTNSQVAQATFTIKAKEVVATPAFSISGGEVEEGTQVTISCATIGATVYYTTDGSAPSTSSAKYTGAITISKAMTIKAIAVKDGYTNSAVAQATFTIKAKEVVATPAISPNGGEYESSATVTLTCATEGASIYYTTDGSVPTTASAIYSKAFTLTESATVKAIATKSGYYTNSQVASAVFTITQPEPEPEPEPEGPTNACGDYLTWEYAGGVLTISGEGDMYDFASAQDAPWASVAAQVTSIVLPDEITRIGNNAFAGCSKVSSLTFDDNDCVFGKNAFASSTYVYLTLDDALKEDFALHANKYRQITLKRSLTNTNYAAIVLPFKPSSETRNDFKFYQLRNILGNYIYYTRVYAPVANVPYLFKNSSSNKNKWATELTSMYNETIDATEFPSLSSGKWTAIGSYKNIKITDPEQLSYSYIMYNNNLTNYTGSISVRPFRAYFEGPVYNSNARQMQLVILDDEDATHIYIVQGDEQEETEAYDMQGRKVKKMIPGNVYIINGKKVLFEQ